MVLRLASSCLSFYRSPHNSGYRHNQKQMGVRKSKRDSRLACFKRPQVLSFTGGDGVGLRVFVVSDLHTDYVDNMSWVESLCAKKYRKDMLIVAGDVAETYKKFVLTMSLLKETFGHVFYVPGNHDLWCRWKSEDFLDSLEKLDKLLDACRRLDVKVNPTVINALGIIPLYSWYHETFDKEVDISGVRVPPLEMACKDYKACKWPKPLSNGDVSLALYFDSMNEKNQDTIEEMKKTCRHIITFSHFVPRQELCPEKRMLYYPNLPKIIGSDSLEARLRSIHGIEGNVSASHVFGHTHFCWDAVLEGIRYVQAPLAYPRERKRRMKGAENWLPFCIYSDGEFADKLSPCFWSDYYSINSRQPHDTQLAPWVAKYYKQRIEMT